MATLILQQNSKEIIFWSRVQFCGVLKLTKEDYLKIPTVW